jgi:GNAT superfamily N-acetyltransferase
MGEHGNDREVAAEAGYVLLEGFPEAADYTRLRAAAGLSPKSPVAAERGVSGTLYGVRVLCGGELVGMGRIVGDGGCFFFVVDIAVEPAHQRRGLGKRIMEALDAWLRSNAPETAHVALFADGEARHLYARFGFVENRKSIGMDYRVGAKSTP